MSQLIRERPIPSFTLPNAAGEQMSIRQRRGKYPTVLLFVSHDDEKVIARYAPAEEELAQYQAALWVIAPQQTAHVLTLIDRDGRVRARFPHGEQAGIVVLDRYTAPLLWHFGLNVAAYPTAEEVVEAVRLSEWSCVI